MANHVGYEFLREALGTGAFPLARPAAVFAVTKVTPMGDYLQVPAHVAPAGEDPLEHLLFALKHEGLEMQAAVLALKKIEGARVAQAFAASPSSQYLRLAAYLWELANQRELEGLPPPQGGYVPLFEPEDFITSKITTKIPRWRVEFNGIGSPDFCPTVRKTEELKRLLDMHTLDAAADFINELPETVLDRAMRWAYLSETRGSYEIEREMPTESKEQAFAALLAQAHEPHPITEEYLVGLQQLAVTNPVLKAFEFRAQQNWLRNSLPGVLGVSYVPPPAQQMQSIMHALMAMANEALSHDETGPKNGIDPIIMGAILSTAFVYAHPFMDGNGRLSRFLFHRMVCAGGKLPNGMVLPISVAMKRNEKEYLQMLQSFSKPAREAWEVMWIDGDQFDFTFKGPPEIYQYWDATKAVEFGLRMGQEALDKDLRAEGDYLARYDQLHAAVNAAVDMGSNDLALLVQMAIQNGGVIPNNRIKRYVAKGHPLGLLHGAQTAIAAVYEEEAAALRQNRLDALPGLQGAAGPAHTFWEIATDAIDDADHPVDVEWPGVHARVAQECFAQHGLGVEEVIQAINTHSPGAVTPAGQAATRLTVRRLWDDLQQRAELRRDRADRM